MTSGEHSSLELVSSIECLCPLNNSSKKKKCFFRLVKVPAKDVVRKTSHAGNINNDFMGQMILVIKISSDLDLSVECLKIS